MNKFDHVSININAKSTEDNIRAIKTCLDEIVDNLNDNGSQTENNIQALRSEVQTLSRRMDEAVLSLNTRMARLEQK